MKNPKIEHRTVPDGINPDLYRVKGIPEFKALSMGQAGEIAANFIAHNKFGKSGRVVILYSDEHKVLNMYNGDPTLFKAALYKGHKYGGDIAFTVERL